MSQCKECVRYHPKGKGNCKLANAWMYLENQCGYKLTVSDCPQYLEPKKVFPEPETSKKKTGNKKVDMEEYSKEWNL